MKWIKIQRIPAIILTAAILSGCGESYCARKYPGFSRSETVYHDTVIITSSKSFDTIVRISGPDTIFLRDERTKIQFQVIRIKGDTVFLKTDCPSDTVVIEKIRSETTMERVKNIVHNNWRKFLWPVTLIVALLFGAGYLIRSIRKK
jgi:uncharacterized protein with PIN domain